MRVSLLAASLLATSLAQTSNGSDVGKSSVASAVGVDGRNRSRVLHLKMTPFLAMTAALSVGTPGQPLRCLLDTGSSDLWLPGADCKDCKSKHGFDATRTSTFGVHVADTIQGELPVPVQVQYGSGAIAGFWVMDTVKVGGVTLPNQSFILVEEASKLPPQEGWDGICGLGFSALMAEGNQPIYKHLEAVGERPVVTFVPGPNRSDAYLKLGEVPLEFADKIAWTKAEPLREGQEHLSYWIASGGVRLADALEPAPSRFMVDTGTNFLLVPPKLHKRFVRTVLPKDFRMENCQSAHGVYLCDCNAAMEEGAVNPAVFVLGGQNFSLTAEDLFLHIADDEQGTPVCVFLVHSTKAPNLPPPTTTPAPDEGDDDEDGPIVIILPPPDGSDPFGDDDDDDDGSSGADPFGPSGGGDPFGPQGPYNPFNPFNPFPGGGSPGDSEEQITWTNGDGSICTRSIRTHNGHVILNATRCEMPGQAGARRLQPAFVDPTADMWTLGATFLNRFVTVFDFEQKRMGFATPTRQEEREFLDSVVVIAEREQPPPQPTTAAASWAPVLCLTPVGLLAYLALRRSRRQSTTLEDGYGPLLVVD